MLDGEDDEAEEAVPAAGDMDQNIKVQSNQKTRFEKHFSDASQCREWINGLRCGSEGTSH